MNALRCRAALACLGLWLIPADQAFSQTASFPATGGISVTGTGEAPAKPDIVEINLRIVGSAELTDDAIVKHKDARQRVQDAFKELNLANMTTEERGLALRPGNTDEQMQAMMRGMPVAASGRTQVEISSTLRVRLSGLRTMSDDDLMKTVGKLLDVAQDSGALVGPSSAEMQQARYYGRTVTGSIVKFIISDTAEIREKAYELAIQDARTRAQRLARLANVELGPATSVNEASVSGRAPTQPRQPWELGTDDSGSADEIAAETLSGTTFRVVLSVRFGIAGQPEDTSGE